MNIGERLRVCRENKDLKQLEVSKILHINNKTLSSYELGTTMPDVETLKRLAQFYEVSTAWLLGSDTSHQHIHSNIIERLEKLNKADIEAVKEYLDFLEFKNMKKDIDS